MAKQHRRFEPADKISILREHLLDGRAETILAAREAKLAAAREARRAVRKAS
jgi:hypothetical protein